MTGHWNKCTRIAAMLVLQTIAVAFMGCRAGAPASAPKPLEVQVSVVAAPDLNPDQTGRASPVFLHVYQLRDGGKFGNADFDAITAHADTTLAGEIVGREEQMIEPGTTSVLRLKIEAETRLLGVVAEYRDPNSHWRATSPAPAGGLLTMFKKQALTIRVGSRAVSVSTGATQKDH